MGEYRHAPAIRRVAARSVAQGLRVVFVPGWEHRGHDEFSAIVGQLNHHDAVAARYGHAGGLRVCTFGRPGLTGPLCMFYIGSDGVIYVVAAGVAWHAGVVSWGSNWTLSGIEARNAGTGEPWPAVQQRAYVVLNAECAREWGYAVAAVRDHREIAVPAGRKIDRYGIDPEAWRAQVARVLAGQEELVYAGTVRKGDEGPIVVYYQHRMDRLRPGILAYEGAKHRGIDGQYGDVTVAAVNTLRIGKGGRIGPREADRLDWQLAVLAATRTKSGGGLARDQVTGMIREALASVRLRLPG